MPIEVLETSEVRQMLVASVTTQFTLMHRRFFSDIKKGNSRVNRKERGLYTYSETLSTIRIQSAYLDIPYLRLAPITSSDSLLAHHSL